MKINRHPVSGPNSEAHEAANEVFASRHQTWSDPAVGDLAAAISIARHEWSRGGGCVSAVAQTYGNHPETAVPRMRWAGALSNRLASALSPTPAALVSRPHQW